MAEKRYSTYVTSTGTVRSSNYDGEFAFAYGEHDGKFVLEVAEVTTCADISRLLDHFEGFPRVIRRELEDMVNSNHIFRKTEISPTLE